MHEVMQQVDGEQTEKIAGALVDGKLVLDHVVRRQQLGNESGDTDQREHDAVNERKGSNVHTPSLAKIAFAPAIAVPAGRQRRGSGHPALARIARVKTS